MRVLLEADHPSFPARLADLARAPSRVWVEGVLPSPWPSAIAIVGTRRPSAPGVDRALRLSRELARAGVLIVSGGALGIDAAAHRGALEAGGTTVAVLPTGLDRKHPASNRSLFREIVRAGGACLSEHPPGAAVGRWSFVTRNRLIAALADWVVVVEGHARSGTRATIEAAVALGRPLGAVPWRPEDPGGAVGLELLRGGALLVTDGGELLARLGIPRARAPRPADALTEALEAHGAQTPDELAARARLPLAEVLARLTSLELEGQVRAGPDGRYR